MKFKGYVCNDEGYKGASEGLWPILVQFSKKSKIMVFED
jgi:hypothetical protein